MSANGAPSQLYFARMHSRRQWLTLQRHSMRWRPNLLSSPTHPLISSSASNYSPLHPTDTGQVPLLELLTLPPIAKSPVCTPKSNTNLQSPWTFPKIPQHNYKEKPGQWKISFDCKPFLCPTSPTSPSSLKSSATILQRVWFLVMSLFPLIILPRNWKRYRSDHAICSSQL